MQRPSIELADLIRPAGPPFILRSRAWFTWLHQYSHNNGTVRIVNSSANHQAVTFRWDAPANQWTMPTAATVKQSISTASATARTRPTVFTRTPSLYGEASWGVAKEAFSTQERIHRLNGIGPPDRPLPFDLTKRLALVHSGSDWRTNMREQIVADIGPTKTTPTRNATRTPMLLANV